MYIKRNFKWTEVKQDAFYEIKRIVACDDLLTYPNFNETFKIHTDARAFQLGAFVSKRGKTINFYGKNITGAQQSYTITEKEIISIVENIKEFRIILPGQNFIIILNIKTLHVRVLVLIYY